jgi:hypothetical protein
MSVWRSQVAAALIQVEEVGCTGIIYWKMTSEDRQKAFLGEAVLLLNLGIRFSFIHSTII